MQDKDNLKQWIAEVSRHMPKLSKAQAVGLALWSFGIVMTQSCGLTTVSSFIAELMGEKPSSMRQRMREWYQGAEAKKGVKRRELLVSDCFAALLGWLLSLISSPEKRLVLALDATTLGERFVVLAIAVMYRQSALYLAWVILPAGQPGSWKGPWLQLLEVLKGHIPADWTVLVLADRGLYAPWLYQAIIDNGWHPFLRIRRGGTFRAKGSKDFKPLRCLAPQVGSYWCGQGTCFKHRPLTCTLLVCWEAGYEGPWFIITDLAPEQADASWYGLRAWIEVGFKHTKRAGWHWHRTRISDPERASRIWLAMAVATLWVMQVGSQVQDQAARENPEALPQAHIARRSRKRTLAPRLLSCFRQGLLSILTALISGRCLPLGYLCPQPWPCSAHSPPTSLPLAA